jgi:DNA repair protein RadD
VNLPELWPIQKPWFESVKTAVHRDNRVIGQAPTGFGKTAVISRIVAGAIACNTKVFIIAHVEELISQISDRLKSYGIPHSFIAADYPTGDELVQVCSQQTLANRLDWYDAPPLIIWDECHHIVSATALKIVDWAIAAGTAIIGVTATPKRLDGKGLGEVFNTIVEGPQIGELIRLGYLVQPIVYAPPTDLDLSKVKRGAKGDYVKQGLEDAVLKSTVVGNAVEQYLKICGGTQAVAFCVNLAHCERVVSAFNEAGIPAASIDGTMRKPQRRAIVSSFEEKHTNILASCNLISEGFDCKAIQTVIGIRPTMSLVLYMQSIGRGMRRDDGKTHMNYLDMVGNVWKEHLGWPDADRDWSDLSGKKARDNKGSNIEIRRCPRCYACFKPLTYSCPQCGFEIPIKERELIEVDGQLVLTTQEQHAQALFEKEQEKKALNMALGKARTKQDFIDIARARNFKNPEGWGEYHYNRRYAKRRA